MLGFLQDLTERLRNNRKERWQRIGEKVDGIKEIREAKKEGKEIPASPLSEKIREKTRQMRERNELKRDEVKQQRQTMREWAKKPRSRIFKIVEYVSTAVAVIPALVLSEMEIWPAPSIREMLKGIGLRGDFFTYFLLALIFYILLIPFRMIIVKALEKKESAQ
ncbi:MAG TPA: hypothetical protein VK826_04235 [Bacteroidia bacterium]|nr:hypothetical protein [Bacteroidia bacterium]